MLHTILPAIQQLQNTSTGSDFQITTDKFGARSTSYKEQILWTNVKTELNNNLHKTVAKQKRFVPNRMNGPTTLE